MNIVFHNLPIKVPLTSGKGASYYKKGDKLPDAVYRKLSTIYRWSDDGFLYDASTSKFVLKRKLGQSNDFIINGQILFSPPESSPKGKDINRMNAVIRATVKSFLMNWFIDQLSKMKRPVIDQYPVNVEFVYNVIKTNCDIDNFHAFYQKALLDAIQEMIPGKKGEEMIVNPHGFIPNDNKQYIRRVEYEVNEGFTDNQLIIRFKPFKQTVFEKILEQLHLI